MKRLLSSAVAVVMGVILVACSGMWGWFGLGGFGGRLGWLGGIGGTSGVGGFGGVGLAWAEGSDVDVGVEAELPEFYIKAINPGYTVEGVSNVGEMIEIGYGGGSSGGGSSGGEIFEGGLVSLAGLRVSYTNSSGNEAVFVEFSEYMKMAGETILLRLASSPGSELANRTYAKTLAFKAGPLTLWRGEEILDAVCWTGKEGCAKEFRAAEPTSLVRNLATGEFEHVVGYEPEFDEGALVDLTPVEEGEGDDGSADDYSGGGGGGQCQGVVFSEILSYYEELQSEQFVEFYNAGAEQAVLSGCFLRYKKKLYPLDGIVKPEGYVVRWASDFALTKNPTSANLLELVDGAGRVVDALSYPNGQRKGTAYAMVGYDGDGEELWQVTYAPTPGEPNNYQEFRSCAEGKVINEATGNCVKVTEVTTKVCPEGQYLNILTGRCKKDASAETAVTECKEGYERNPETGRCRKIRENDGTDYALVAETYEEGTSFVAVVAVLVVAGLGVAYLGWEFRREIVRGWRWVVEKMWRR